MTAALIVGRSEYFVCTSANATDGESSHQAVAASTGLRLNEIQVLGSHNSYHLKPMVDLYRFFDRRAGQWEYSHRPLTEQLELLGIRAFELDLFVDDETHRFARPIGVLGRSTNAAFDLPGIKVLHVPDLDQGSTCPTLAGCLNDLAAWSVTHPTHLPVFVMLECVHTSAGKNGPIEFVQAAPWTPVDLLELEETVRESFSPEQLIHPDLVRRDSATLHQGILKYGWPEVDAVRGRFMFIVTNTSRVIDAYQVIHPQLRGALLFVEATPPSDNAAFIVINNPISQKQEIEAAANQGLIVRTRADADLEEGRRGDTARRTEALDGRAVIVSTDFPEPRPSLKTDYVVTIPSATNARVHPFARHPRAGAPIHP
ncbi:MAG: Ca2+-dependent phosphoinositide-specific phospholipase C [Planctomycetota bacterium]|nr:Ca2+-dependent phosphoinositide-specific phospholipase C [Planctomycetota bacterium]